MSDWREGERRLSEEATQREIWRAKDPRRYVASYMCPECGEAHRFDEKLRPDPSPGRRGTVAELYPDPERSHAVVVSLMTACAVRCETAGDQRPRAPVKPQVLEGS